MVPLIYGWIMFHIWKFCAVITSSHAYVMYKFQLHHTNLDTHIQKKLCYKFISVGEDRMFSILYINWISLIFLRISFMWKQVSGKCLDWWQLLHNFFLVLMSTRNTCSPNYYVHWNCGIHHRGISGHLFTWFYNFFLRTQLFNKN